jgi:hypothetical protein
MKEDIREVIDLQVESDESIENAMELYERLDFDGSVHQIIDSNIDIYYYDLRKWAVDNWHWVDDALEEGFCEGVTDYHQLIQAGQYMSLSSDARAAIAQLYTELDGIAFNVEVTA